MMMMMMMTYLSSKSEGIGRRWLTVQAERSCTDVVVNLLHVTRTRGLSLKAYQDLTWHVYVVMPRPLLSLHEITYVTR